MRRKTRKIQLGNIFIGGDAPISVQSMCNTDTRDVLATVAQIKALEKAGCEIVRCAVPDETAAKALADICSQSSLPVVADIHFDYRLALQSLDSGVSGLRVNPGNIGEKWKVEEITKVCAERNVPIRIGVNAGSLDKDLLARFGEPSADAMVESSLENIRILEDLNFHEMKVSLKASDVNRTVSAYQKLSEKVDYPLHIGITEAGTIWSGSIKSAAGLGALLSAGIGDTLRVSLTANPLEEVRVGWEILKCLNLRQRGPVFISCPTCGRCEINLIDIAEEVEKRLKDFTLPLKIAIMGCVVNGPGEAREADLGIAGGKGQGLLFRKGRILRKVPQDKLADALVAEALSMAEKEQL